MVHLRDLVLVDLLFATQALLSFKEVRMDLLKELALPEDVVLMIYSFLGFNYFKDRSDLTLASAALDFWGSDYTNDTWWRWSAWRKRHPFPCLVTQPRLPPRLEKANLEKTCPWVKSLNPPSLSVSLKTLRRLHEEFRRRVFQDPGHADESKVLLRQVS